MSENLEGWPFLYGRLWRYDYQTLIAPEFIDERKTNSIRTNVAKKELTGEDEAFYLEIHSPSAGELTLVFRVIETTFADMKIERSGVLKDVSGREICLTEGIVIQGWFQNEELIVTKDDLEDAHQKLIDPYLELWGEIGSSSVKPSKHIISLPQDRPSSSCLQYRIEKPSVPKTAKSPKTQEETEKSQESVSETLKQPQLGVSENKQISNTQQWIDSKTYPFLDEVTSAIFLPEGKDIAIRHEQEQIISLMNLETEKGVSFRHEHIPIELTRCPTPIAISPNSQYMASGVIKTPEQNIVKLWTIADTKKAPKESSPFGRILAVAFTPDSNVLLSGGKDKTIFFWDVKTGFPHEKPIKLSSEIMAIAVSPKEYPSIFAIGDAQGRIESWDWNSRKKIKTFALPNGLRINSLAFSPDGKILVSGGYDNSIKLWDVDKAEELKRGQHSAIVTTVTFSPDGKLIASGDEGGMIKIWNIETMESVVLPKHYGAVTSVAFSPDGKTLASASKDRTVRLWERV